MIGFAGNGRYDQTGGGTNYQCMPNIAVYNNDSGVNDDGFADVIVGVEYESFGFDAFPIDALNNNAPCAVCYATNRTSVLMIPAQRDCADGWHKEYEGILAISSRNL